MSDRRFDILRAIEQLDPERDRPAHRASSFGYDFPGIRSERSRSLFIGPTASRASPRYWTGTGEFRTNTQRRHDDTSILSPKCANGATRAVARKEALERMNWVHGHFTDRQRRLSLRARRSSIEPIRWIDTVGWRPTCTNEKHGATASGVKSGSEWGSLTFLPRARGVRGVEPPCERQNFRFADTNQRVGTSTRDLLRRGFRESSRRSSAAHLRDAGRGHDLVAPISSQPRSPLASLRCAASSKLRGRVVDCCHRAGPRISSPTIATGRNPGGLRDFAARPAAHGCR